MDLRDYLLYEFECTEPFNSEEVVEVTKYLYIKASKEKVKELVKEFVEDEEQEDRWDLPTFTSKLEENKIDYLDLDELAEATFELAYPEE